MKGKPKTLRGEIDTILEMIDKGGAQMVYHSMGDEDVERIMRYPNTAFGSDGGIREFGVGQAASAFLWDECSRSGASMCARKTC